MPRAWPDRDQALRLAACPGAAQRLSGGVLLTGTVPDAFTPVFDGLCPRATPVGWQALCANFTGTRFSGPIEDPTGGLGRAQATSAERHVASDARPMS
jgi:hypothetical protein